MGHEVNILSLSEKAIGSFASSQYFAAKPSGTDGADVPTVQGEALLGLIRNDPAINQQSSIGMLGVYSGKLGGTVSLMDQLTTGTDGKLIRARPGDHIIGVALAAGVSNDVISVFVCPKYPEDIWLTASDDMSAKVGYSVKAHSVAGQTILGSNGCHALGICLVGTNAAAIKIRTRGFARAVAGTGGLSEGNLVGIENAGKVVLAATGDHVLGVALEAIAADATGWIFIQHGGTAA